MNELILKLITENPDTVVGEVHEYIEKYKPLIYGLCRECVKIASDYVNNDDIYKLRAIAKKKAFDAYKEAGFTEDQAIAFIINDNLQLMENLQKVSVSKDSATTKTKTKKDK